MPLSAPIWFFIGGGAAGITTYVCSQVSEAALYVYRNVRSPRVEIEDSSSVSSSVSSRTGSLGRLSRRCEKRRERAQRVLCLDEKPVSQYSEGTTGSETEVFDEKLHHQKDSTNANVSGEESMDTAVDSPRGKRSSACLFSMKRSKKDRKHSSQGNRSSAASISDDSEELTNTSQPHRLFVRPAMDRRDSNSTLGGVVLEPETASTVSSNFISITSETSETDPSRFSSDRDWTDGVRSVSELSERSAESLWAAPQPSLRPQVRTRTFRGPPSLTSDNSESPTADDSSEVGPPTPYQGSRLQFF